MIYCRWAPILALTLLIGEPAKVLAEQGDDSALMQLHGQHAIGALFGLPAVAARPVQTRELQVSLEHSNQFMGGSAGEQTLLLDGETSELTIHHRQRIGPCIQLEAAVPFIQHSGGTFDKTIDQWHSAFGLPDAERNQAPLIGFAITTLTQPGLISIWRLLKAESVTFRYRCNALSVAMRLQIVEPPNRLPVWV